MQDRHLCWPPYFFLGPAVAPHFLNSRIATGDTHTAKEPHSRFWCYALMK